MERGHEPLGRFEHNFGGLGPFTPKGGPVEHTIEPGPDKPSITISMEDVGKPVVVHWTWPPMVRPNGATEDIPEWWQIWLPIKGADCVGTPQVYAYVSWGGPVEIIKETEWYELLDLATRRVYIGEEYVRG